MSKISALKLQPSAAYETFWKFAVERQNVFLNQFIGLQDAENLTIDPILREYKFTNAYRACDRVSQYLIRNVIYRERLDVRSLFLRIILFKLFNKIETWEMLEREFGFISLDNYSSSRMSDFLNREMVKGVKIYSNAYMMAS